MAKNGLTIMAKDIFNKFLGLGKKTLYGIGIGAIVYIALMIFIYFQITQPISGLEENAAFRFFQKILGIVTIFCMIYFPLKLVYVFFSRMIDKRLPEQSSPNVTPTPSVATSSRAKNLKTSSQNYSLGDSFKKILGWLIMILFFFLVVFLFKTFFTSNNTKLEEGIFPVMRKSIFGNSGNTSSSGKSESKKQKTTYQYEPKLNPTTKYKQDAKTERTRLHYEYKEKEWEHQEKMKEIEIKNGYNHSSNEILHPSQMVANPQLNNWDQNHNYDNYQKTSTNNNGFEMKQLEGFQYPH